MKNSTGVFILSLSLLTISIIIMLAKISLLVDKLQGTFRNDIMKYIPISIYFLIGIPIIIGIVLIFDKSKDNIK